MPTLNLTDREVDILVNLLKTSLKDDYHDNGDPEMRRKNLVKGILPRNLKEEIRDVLGKLEYVQRWWNQRIEDLELKLDRLRELEQRIIKTN
ncbi:MAG: hypothetical protein L6N96_03285 [Candidatus Methylarchaceae archaeon HK02M2]|nr:hypothetical protein [Candidatus Methylarchaceae archaeon HK02M2]